MYFLLLFLAFSFYAVDGEVDYALECDKGYRISSVRRTKTAYNILGSLTIECEVMARSAQCTRQAALPRCNGKLEGCNGNSWLAGMHIFLLENSTQAVAWDPVCCQSPTVKIDSGACIHDQLNQATKDFSHSIVSDLVYRGTQCYHQYNSNNTLVDFVWRAEVCPFVSLDLPPPTEDNCADCECFCGIQQCSDGSEPVRVVHKRRTEKCGCDCRCNFFCVKFN